MAAVHADSVELIVHKYIYETVSYNKLCFRYIIIILLETGWQVFTISKCIHQQGL